MEDDDEDSLNTSMGSTIYACTPSLMALQQMKNRLHMAYLGKRLMKWTVLATSRDLRRIAIDISVAYGTLLEDVREALVMVARCRYFHSQLNAMTIENHPALARLTVSQVTKSLAGCKFRSFEVIDCDEEVYVHLGIDKGGQLIAETKLVWLRLIRKIIDTLSLRISFQYLDAYTKVATKKMNVLSKIVIPKTLNTIKYILLELEERSREDFFRLKKIVDIKRKRRAKREVELKQKCATCSALMRGVLVEEKCVCLETGKGLCKVQESTKIPICIEESKLEEIVKSADFEDIMEEHKDKEREISQTEPENVVKKDKHNENENDFINFEDNLNKEENLKRESCEGPCIRIRATQSKQMIIYDHKRHLNVDEDKSFCEGPCTTNMKSKHVPEIKDSTRIGEKFKNQYSNIGPKKVKIDSKTDFEQKEFVDAIKLPSCICLEPKKVEPSTSYGTSDSNSEGSGRASCAGSSTGEIRKTSVDTSVKRYTKIKRFQDCDGVCREEKITITIQTDSYEVPLDDDNVQTNESETDNDEYTIGCCISTDQSTALNTPQILSQIRSEPVKKQCCHHKARSSRSFSNVSNRNDFSSDSSTSEFTHTVTRVYEYDTSGDSSPR